MVHHKVYDKQDLKAKIKEIDGTVESDPITKKLWFDMRNHSAN